MYGIFLTLKISRRGATSEIAIKTIFFGEVISYPFSVLQNIYEKELQENISAASRLRAPSRVPGNYYAKPGIKSMKPLPWSEIYGNYLGPVSQLFNRSEKVFPVNKTAYPCMK